MLLKYASNFYGPFRDAVGSKKNTNRETKRLIKWILETDSNEALREVSP